jgi:hypothetical protein
MAFNPTGLLIIRAWIEPASSKPLRAQIRLTTNVSDGITSEMTLVEISSVSAQVEAWLHDVLLGSIPAAGDKPKP